MGSGGWDWQDKLQYKEDMEKERDLPKVNVKEYMNEAAKLEQEVRDLKVALENKEKEIFALKHPIKARLAVLHEERKTMLEGVNKKIRDVLDSCPHNYVHYEYELDNYDRDRLSGYKCTECEKDITVPEYKRIGL